MPDLHDIIIQDMEGSLAMNIVLIAHDAKKEDIVNLSVSYQTILSKHQLYATGTTGLRIQEATNLPIHRFNSGPLGGDQQVGSLVSENKILAHPASVDSIVSSNGQEDHVSMGANGATKCLRVIENLETILAIELMNASQALKFREPKSSSPFIESFLKPYRSIVPFIENDRIIADDIHATIAFIQSLDVDSEIIFD